MPSSSSPPPMVASPLGLHRSRSGSQISRAGSGSRSDTTVRLRSPLPHLQWDLAQPCHICTGTGSLLPHLHWGLGSPLPHLHGESFGNCNMQHAIIDAMHTGDDGRLYAFSSVGVAFGPTFGVGDTVRHRAVMQKRGHSHSHAHFPATRTLTRTCAVKSREVRRGRGRVPHAAA
jgi:hypothetical protein